MNYYREITGEGLQEDMNLVTEEYGCGYEPDPEFEEYWEWSPSICSGFDQYNIFLKKPNGEYVYRTGIEHISDAIVRAQAFPFLVGYEPDMRLDDYYENQYMLQNDWRDVLMDFGK